MKGSHPVITLLGSNSGNNVGDAAILASILSALSKRLPDAEFLVPTTKPSFIRKHYGSKYNVKAIDVMPWTGSVRFVGIPTVNAIRKSDAALICDGIIFGKKLWNPLFNFLITLVFLAPFAKRYGCKLVCYSCGIGPFPTKQGETFARYVMNECELVMLREEESIALAKKIGVTRPITLTGDAAFLNDVSSEQRGDDVLAAQGIPTTHPLFGVNVTRYMDGWMPNSRWSRDPSACVRMLAAGIKQANTELGEAFTPVVFSTHPMDDGVADELGAALRARVIRNSEYISHDMQAVMHRCELFMGMRFHSLILASAVGAPIIGLIYAPKVRGYMHLLGTPEHGLTMADATEVSVAERIVTAWRARTELARKQQRVVNELKDRAERAADVFVEKFYPERVGTTARREAVGAVL